MNNKSYYIIFLFFLSGCVEHIFLINIKPTGNFNINYESSGNLDDMKNIDYPLPNSSEWEITSPIHKKNNEYFFSSNKNFNQNEKITGNFTSSDSIPHSISLKHPIEIKKSNFILFEIISFKCSFKNRQAHNKYPKLEKWLDNPDNNPKGMIKEILMYIINQSIHDANLGFNIFPIVQNDINNWFNNHINQIQDSIIFNDLDNYLNQSKNIIQSNLMIQKTNIDSIMNIYKREAEITMNLIDDDFKMKVNMPNTIFIHNSDTLINEMLIWEFGLEGFIKNDKNLYSYSYKINYINIIISLVFLIISYFYKKNVPSSI